MEEEGTADRPGLVNVYVEKLTQMTKVEDEYILTLDG
jgi:formylmethanofuran dehydrogenase subunit B